MIGKPSYGGEQNSGIVIMLKIGQSAWLQPKDAKKHASLWLAVRD
uniref:Uncharacterized protein n=1 Tax=viral metagenome TaxID=1070528 RepID=A0A6C0H267_9ZZZZ